MMTIRAAFLIARSGVTFVVSDAAPINVFRFSESQRSGHKRHLLLANNIRQLQVRTRAGTNSLLDYVAAGDGYI